MPDLLLELFCEEIPARMQRRAANDLKAMVGEGLVAAGLAVEGAYASATPRRLVLHVAGVPPRSPDRSEERRGPRVGAPEKAVEGFLRASGLASIDAAQVHSDPKKGDFYVARIEAPGRAASEIVADLIPDVIRRFPWPKSMRWGAGSADAGALRWVRPLQSVVCTFGPETEEPEVVRFAVPGVEVGDVTRGHRFMAPEPFAVRRMADYAKKLFDAKVILDIDRRKNIIAHDARDRALALGLELVEDPGLLEEVAGLVEWPVVLVGRFDEDFLALPDEVIRLTIRENQKCFVMRDCASGGLANAFVLTANIEASDGGSAIVAGNERVVRARLSDARFFYQTDLDTPLEEHAKKLAGVTFHERLGTQADRVERIARLARELAPTVGADPDLADRAARLAKADLVTGMVGEFPELQGYIGRRYAEAHGERPEVAAAIEEHYRPLGPSDDVPTAPVSVAVALADKLDMLVGLWAIGEKPTGSKDPYAMRRAALGVIRILLENNLKLYIRQITERHADSMGYDHGKIADEIDGIDLFFEDRLRAQLREEGARHDLVHAVVAEAGATVSPLLLIVRRVEALGRFLDAENGRNLLAGYRRAANIIRIEEKKDGRSYDQPPDPAHFVEPAERELATRIGEARAAAAKAVEAEDFEAAMDALSTLRAPVDRFFDEILVNVDDPGLRENRLRLLNEIRAATRTVADFSQIAG